MRLNFHCNWQYFSLPLDIVRREVRKIKTRPSTTAPTAVKVLKPIKSVICEIGQEQELKFGSLTQMRNTILAAVGKGHRKLMILLITDRMFQYFTICQLGHFLNEERIVGKLTQRNTTQVLLKMKKKLISSLLFQLINTVNKAKANTAAFYFEHFWSQKRKFFLHFLLLKKLSF